MEKVIKELSAALTIMERARPNEYGIYKNTPQDEHEYECHFDVGLGWARALDRSHREYEVTELELLDSDWNEINKFMGNNSE